VSRFAGRGALALLGIASALAYSTSLPVAYRPRMEPLAAHVVVFGALFLLYLAAVRIALGRAARARGTLALVLAFGLLFRILMLPTPVYLSSDVYRYLWDGRVQLAGVNPYRHPPAAPALADLRDGETHPQINRPWAPTVYPPGAQWLFALAAATAPNSLIGWRVLLLGFDALAVVLLLCLLRRLGAPDTAVLVYAWSPLVVFEGVQAGHVDLAVIPLVLLALGWRQGGSSVRAGIALGLATLVKLYPAVLLLAWWRRGDLRFPAAAAATVALGYAPYAAALGLGALGFLPEYFESHEDHNIGLRALLTFPLGLTGETPRAVAMTVLFAVMLAALGAIARTRRPEPRGTAEAAALAAGAYLLLVPTSMHPWYVMWIVPFLVLTRSPAWLYFSGAVTLSYLKYVVEPAPFPWWAWAAEYVPLYALLSVAGWRMVARRTAVSWPLPAA
jgi:alpha-1,6-mannosyltransferase